jgi:hypothetical protein
MYAHEFGDAVRPAPHEADQAPAVGAALRAGGDLEQGHHAALQNGAKTSRSFTRAADDTGSSQRTTTGTSTAR